MKKRLISVLLAACLAAVPAAGLTACAGGTSTGSAKVVKLDPANPTTLTVWHYYNGAQQAAFDKLVSEFNDTVGKEQGIYVSASSQGSVSDLENAVIDSADGVVGADPLPDVFSTYNDIAATVMEKTELANIADYFTGDELSDYVDSYIQDGYINGDDKLYVFPVAKSSETFMMSEQDWDEFSKATGATLDELSTQEGVCEVAKEYYEYTDAKTPKIKNDGKSFYGRDSMSNLFLLTFNQLGQDLVTVKDGTATLNTDKTIYRRVWDNYYVPFVNGYFNALGRFRSDDVKTGDIVAYTGSTASAGYFPQAVDSDNGKTKNITALVQNVPVAQGGTNSIVQQGAGMAVTKTDETHEYAASIFLKWFTQPENNLRFVSESGYLPVRKDANTVEALDSAIANNGLEISDSVYAVLKNFMENFDSAKIYSYPSFKNATALRKVLDYELLDKATADKKAIDKKVAKGASKKKVVSSYTDDEAFEAWYETFVKKLQDALDA